MTNIRKKKDNLHDNRADYIYCKIYFHIHLGVLCILVQQS